MEPNLIQSHQHLNESFDALVSAHQFLTTHRPLKEVLSIIDRGLIAINDAKAEMVKFRELIYLRHQQECNQTTESTI